MHPAIKSVTWKSSAPVMPGRDGFDVAWVGHGCGVRVTHIATGLSDSEERSLSSEMNADLCVERLTKRVRRTTA